MNTESLLSDFDPLWGILIRLAVELAVLIIIIPIIYKRYSGNKGQMFAFFLMGIMIFSICALLKSVEIQMGMVLGLFAIFSIVRFRTLNFSTKDMSYLFSILGLSAINAMFDFPHPIRGTIIFNSIIILTILILEFFFWEAEPEDYKKIAKKEKKVDAKPEKNKSECQLLIYDNLRLLNPEMKDDLLKDIYSRTGLKITEIKIRKIDLTRSIAELEITLGDSMTRSQPE